MPVLRRCLHVARRGHLVPLPTHWPSRRPHNPTLTLRRPPRYAQGYETIANALADPYAHIEKANPNAHVEEVPPRCAQGYETTANALAFTMHLLGMHPEAEARLVAEVGLGLGLGVRLGWNAGLKSAICSRTVQVR